MLRSKNMEEQTGRIISTMSDVEFTGIMSVNTNNNKTEDQQPKQWKEVEVLAVAEVDEFSHSRKQGTDLEPAAAQTQKDSLPPKRKKGVAYKRKQAERMALFNKKKIEEKVATDGSRNDQVATDMRLWLRKGIRQTLAALGCVVTAAVAQATEHVGLLMPCYNHMQLAQPVQFSSWLLSHVWPLHQDCERLGELRERANVLPSGNPLGIHRASLAARLAFASLSQNTMHAVADRDFVVDFIYCCSMISSHLSRWAEDLIFYTTRDIDFLRLADAFLATGSSLKPQEPNPDSLELVRSASALVSSQLVGMLINIKGTPSTYNNNDETKQYCFDAFDKLQQMLNVMTAVVTTMQVQRHQLEAALSPDMLATDWTYYLVRKGVPFQQAHNYIGAVIAYAEKVGKKITEIPLGELQNICPDFGSDIVKVADVGGTATNSVLQQIQTLEQFLHELRNSE